MANPELDAVAAQLAEEIAFTHAAIMGVHKFAGQGGDPALQLNCMKIAARMMQAQVAAALSLQRLKGGNTHRFTYVLETPPPTPKKLKTNVPGSNVKEEDEMYLDYPGAPEAREKAAD